MVEDYGPVRDAVATALREAGYAVDAAADGIDGLWHAESGGYDALVLDVMLPGHSGSDILDRLRGGGDNVPVLLLTAKDTVADRVDGLQRGADDYLGKPFAVAELVARVGALVRRGHGGASAVIRVGTLSIDTAARRVCRNEQAIELTAREFGLLELLARRAGQVVSRREIWDSLYEADDQTASNVVDVYVGYLRRKLGPELIRTRRGQGYMLVADRPHDS